MRTSCLFLLLLLCLASGAQRVTTGPAPAWVTRHELNYRASGLEDGAGDGYIDLDFEKQVSLSEQTVFIRTAKRVLSEAGVQNASEVSVDYDPGYEQLVLHTVQLRRGDRIIDKLQPARFELMRQERERDEHLYNGSLTALLLLDDVRQGDVIEYSYSIRGFNPVFGGRYAEQFDTRFSVPIYHVYYKLLAPAGRHLVLRNRGEGPAAVPVRSGAERGWEWTLRNTKALPVEDRLPGWYDPFPVLEVSEWASWKDVIDWACTLFPPVQNKEVEQLATRLKARYATDAERTVAALRFVEEEVRYLGIEMGAGSHRPTAPGRVLAQRFGDCKDKSYLLCTLLHAMGIEAWPVLTNTEDRRAVKGWLPTPSAFDHCTVQARVAGKIYWFDPTSTGQRGSLDAITYPNYEVGLVVRPGDSGFSDVALQDKGRIEVTEKFTMKDFSGAGRLQVTTVFTGSWADGNRDAFRSSRRADKLKEYQDYYAAYFDKVTADSIRYVDDEAANRFTVQEYYSIRDLWQERARGGRRLSVYPFVINAYLHKPSDARRTMPFALEYPLDIRERVELELPEDWDLEAFDEVYSGPGFRMTSAGRSNGPHVVLNYSYATSADHVRPEDIDAYLAAYRRADDNVAYNLTYTGDGTLRAQERPRPAAAYVPFTLRDLYPLLYVLLGLAVFVTWMLRRRARH
ncbi:DUF3857 domain-containing transglutaminase family protein [Flaviaesturariibacter aridisoli]|uniref:DUF3857 domain-containing protein n=1 Tax=Flaviaesturariibacter aridisoli TaxID=2545761 RepID=A0A4R4E5K2_9BACT|nr:DUF3857 domain-containing protein [Flaviaesturariibacter aridisoli]TCZ74924.1 DUF3857 domain-containing protein [Flaviaesturariibacter aridisoli]